MSSAKSILLFTFMFLVVLTSVMFVTAKHRSNMNNSPQKPVDLIVMLDLKQFNNQSINFGNATNKTNGCCGIIYQAYFTVKNNSTNDTNWEFDVVAAVEDASWGQRARIPEFDDIIMHKTIDKLRAGDEISFAPTFTMMDDVGESVHFVAVADFRHNLPDINLKNNLAHITINN